MNIKKEIEREKLDYHNFELMDDGNLIEYINKNKKMKGIINQPKLNSTWDDFWDNIGRQVFAGLFIGFGMGLIMGFIVGLIIS